MFSSAKLFVSAGVITLVAASGAQAQLNVQWAEYQNSTATRLDPTVTGISSQSTEVEFAWGDLDKNGWIDLVVVRKQAFTSPGKRTNYLLMNYNGVLTNKTNDFATLTDVVGDNGFNTVTNDRDVQLADFNQDGWLDVVTATTISDGDPKHIGHPRIYMNRGDDVNGNWLGLKFEAGRSPQMLNGGGNPQNPRFCSVAAGDLTGDGYPDLFFGDYDSSGAGGSGEPGANDLNDRLWINGGASNPGFFTDQSIGSGRMTSGMLLSAFSMASLIADFNQDGANDVIKDTALNPPQNISAIYNNPANKGFFNIHHVFHTNAPYHVNTGDLNKDGKLDLIMSDDGSDGFRFNTGNDGLGRVTWSAYNTYQFAAGGDTGFDSDNIMFDANNDGWMDTAHCDVDVDINEGTGSGIMAIYHNKGGTPGAFNIALKHERELSSTSMSTGWRGVKGMVGNDLANMHDVAPFDVDNDGDTDLVLGNMQGLFVWTNKLDPAPVCQPSIGFKSAGSTANLTVCGGNLTLGHDAVMQLTSAEPLRPAYLFVSLSSSPVFVPAINNTLAAFPVWFMIGLGTAADGSLALPVPGAASPVNFDLYVQYVIAKANGNYETSNAVKMTYPAN